MYARMTLLEIDPLLGCCNLLFAQFHSYLGFMREKTNFSVLPLIATLMIVCRKCYLKMLLQLTQTLVQF